MADIRKISFSEAINETQEDAVWGQRHLLLGNGFSIAWSPKFENRNLVREVMKDSRLAKYFKGDKPNFEAALGEVHSEKVEKCIEVEKCVDCFHKVGIFSDIVKGKDTESARKDCKKKIEEAKLSIDKLVEKSFAAIQREILEACITAVSAAQYVWQEDYQQRLVTCSGFLLNFNKIFTVNYDELLYKTCIQATKIANDLTRFTDNFSYRGGRYLTWQEINTQSEQTVFYLHGALFYYQNKGNNKLYKLTSKENATLSETVSDVMSRGYMPLFVAGAKSEDKLKIIRNNDYLNACYEQLRKIRGVIFIFGHSVRDEDKHLYDALFQNENLKSLYFCMQNPDNDLTKNLKVKNLNAWKKSSGSKVEISYVDSADLDIWGIK